MNKYKEAKEWIDKINDNPKWNRVDIEEPALSQLTELVEKATPKKPIMYKPRSVERPYCGFCSLRLKKTWVVCPRCGTRIDWSEDDENS